VSYLPVPLGGAITALFVIERLWTQAFFIAPSSDTISHVSTE
jgi:TRAP-type C4-dicarboxylate transport system permease small subunit